jgi:hypothetical protein
MFLLVHSILRTRRSAFVFSSGVQHGVVCIAVAFGVSIWWVAFVYRSPVGYRKDTPLGWSIHVLLDCHNSE